MASNSVRQVPLLTLLLVACLVGFSFIPEQFWSEYELKPIRLFSSIEKNSKPVLPENPALIADVSEEKEPDSVTVAPKVITKDSGLVASVPCPKGQTCIEDYDSTGQGLKQIMKALAEEAQHKPVRIAFFGDSFIEGDMLCGDFRDTLQALFGGKGVGYVPVTSPVANFRVTIRHQFKNFKTYSVQEKTPGGPPLGVSGYSFVPEGNNVVNFKTAAPYGPSHFERVRLFYRANQNSRVTYTLGKNAEQSDSLAGQGYLTEHDLHTSGDQIRMSFGGSLALYGLSFESDHGVYVDNFSMRGNSGWGLLGVSESMYQQFNKLQHYKLVILQYGLNVIQPNTTQLGWYVPKMMAAIERIKRGFPEASILIIGVSDRSMKQEDNYISFPSIPYLIAAQRKMSQKTGVTFWNLWEAMGGEGSMVKYVNAGLANKDYTHMKYAGGRKIARLLTRAFLFEKKKYDQNRTAGTTPGALHKRPGTENASHSDASLTVRNTATKRDLSGRKPESVFR
ncbi:hypothetical protein BWI96_01080 [Siphonobacter sp. SORGH_AS_0500]|uniref:hypothetical protein n=1 Tax=Siphonobacter sp. SORGH_AS_0500 TaxID=1864824 RepID=UPI000CB14EE6|nr:hypothetical protein [Siphonobacter sp. SORGH_AS_0500]PKK38402.1 hypothetical protein BWI96_01080 [Siphonobacter sp. SORGH_AS_0500]